MDNLCHTLVGAACAEAGLKRGTALGRATLMIAANLPDIDVLVFATSVPSVAFRRGWTHGVLAQALLPAALAGAMMLIGQRRHCRFGSLLLLSYVGVLSHVALDLLNNYGVRILMPFSGRWFYGDAVFILDPWLWLILGAGVWWALRRANVRAARAALVVAAVYILVMVVSARLARGIVLEEWSARHGAAPPALMVGPMALTPFHRVVIVDAGGHYETGTFTWSTRRTTFDSDIVPKGDGDPAVRRAKATDPRVRAVLVWARFPYFRVQRSGTAATVYVGDMRFGERVGAVRATVIDR